VRTGHSLTYEMHGSTSVGEKGYWRWIIVSPSSKRTLQVGSFYGPFPQAQTHAEAAIVRLKARNEKHPSVAFSRPANEPNE